MNSKTFFLAVKRDVSDWLLAYRDSATVLWSIADTIREYEQKFNVLSDCEDTVEHPYDGD